jgi:hypothetical protein
MTERFNIVAAVTPFSPEERSRLERYVERTRRLYESAFIQHGNTQWNLGYDGEALTSQLSGDDERELAEALLLFRPLWLKDENSGFWKVQAMVKRHAHEKGSPEGQELIKTVKTYTAAIERILSERDLMALREQRVDPAGNVVSTEDVPPRRVFEDFLNGLYFHEDEQRIARIGDGLQSDAQRFIFVSAVKHLARVFTTFAGTPRAILRVPSLRADA